MSCHYDYSAGSAAETAAENTKEILEQNEKILKNQQELLDFNKRVAEEPSVNNFINYRDRATEEAESLLKRPKPDTYPSHCVRPKDTDIKTLVPASIAGPKGNIIFFDNTHVEVEPYWGKRVVLIPERRCGETVIFNDNSFLGCITEHTKWDKEKNDFVIDYYILIFHNASFQEGLYVIPTLEKAKQFVKDTYQI